MNLCVLVVSLRELSFGRGSTAPVGGGAFPAISTREPWDGKDGEVSPQGPRLCVQDSLLGLSSILLDFPDPPASWFLVD